jgi:hypothetical protein
MLHRSGSQGPPVPTVNPKQLSIACESVDNHGDGRSPKFIWYAVAGLFRSHAALQTEVVALRHQLNVLRRRAPKRVTVSNMDRLVFAGLYHPLTLARSTVSPE